MKVVYCIFFDYQGYEEQLQAIYENMDDAIERLTDEAHDYDYKDVVVFMREGELSLVKWECGTNNRQVVLPSYKR